MKRFAVTLTAVAFVFGLTALASAQTQQPGAASLHAQARNFTPLLKQAACNGLPGPFCGPGWVRRCWRGPFGRLHCRCVPC
jgi:orotidine-5'-phosphate decarboxylase